MIRNKHIHSLNSRCHATIWHFKNNQIISSDNEDIRDLEVDTITFNDKGSNPIIFFRYTKNLLGSPGEYEMHLAPDANYLSKISPGDWMVVSLTNSKGIFSRRCFGNVNRVSREYAIDSAGKPSLRYVIHGFDFGKAFFKTTLFINTLFADQFADLYGKWLKLTQTTSTADVWVDNLIATFLGNRLGSSAISEQFSLPGEATSFFGRSGPLFYDFLNRDIATPQPGARLSLNPLPNLTTLWQVMVLYSHPQLNILYYEMQGEPGKEVPTLFMKPYPYLLHREQLSLQSELSSLENYLYFRNTEAVTVNRSKIHLESIGIADHERVNTFFMYSSIENADVGVTSAFDLKKSGFDGIMGGSIYRHGTQVDYNQSEFTTLNNEYKVNSKLLYDMNRLRQSWFANNHNLMNGMIGIDGMPEIRVGKRLVIDNDNSYYKAPHEYYIMGYTDVWNFPGLWKQQLILGRGIYVINGQERYLTEAETQDFKVLGGSVITGMER